MPFVTTWMDLESIRLSDRSQTEKDKQPYDFTHVWKLKHEANRSRLFHSEDGWLPPGEVDGGDGRNRQKGLRLTAFQL